MNAMYIKATKIRGLSRLKRYNLSKIEIGIPVMNGEDMLVGLKNIGDMVIPSKEFGPLCEKNAYGYSYADTSRPKERRCVSTNWIHPYGNENALPIPVDIYKDCYPRVEIPPYEIALYLYADKGGKRYVLVDLTEEVRSNLLKMAINLLLEIFGFCYIFDEEIRIDTSIKRNRCNWEILPPGEKPSWHIEKQLLDNNNSRDTFDVYRLKYIERYSYELVVEGVQGFNGYFAYLFDKHCVFESAIYGNATYIIPRDNWEVLSQKTKKELFNEDKLEKKIIHTENWRQNIDKTFRELGITIRKEA